MKLYNTLSRQVEDFQPIHPPAVSVYTCGPTVYDYAHIGHWFTYVRWDTLIRALKANNYQPTWVMNITDVGHLVSDADEGEDKLEKGARREGKTAWEVAEFYSKDFVDGMKALNMFMPDEMPRATQHIPEQIELIQQLEAKGYTYVITDGVYYDTSKFPSYANFAKLDLEEQQAGARVEVNPEKRNPTDFALWKFSPKDRQRDMEWDSPWGKGFPGWHIECSAMSMKYLGKTIDIHTGGIDHVPVHHTNEIAQSEAATGKPFAKIWLHSNHVLVNGEKISKSLGNGIRWQELAEKGISADVIRLHILSSHYRSQSKFSIDELLSAQSRLKGIRNDFYLLYQKAPVEGFENNKDFFKEFKTTIDAALGDDLNTPEALAALNEASRAFSVTQRDVNKKTIDDFISFIQDRLGISIIWSREVNENEEKLLQDREQARASQNWSESDRLRIELQKQGIVVEDGPLGQNWHRA